VNLRKDHYIN